MSQFEKLNVFIKHKSSKVFFLSCVYMFCIFRAEAVLQHIAELNPYVHVTSSSVPLNETTDLSFLNKYQVSTPFYIRYDWQILSLKVGLKLGIQKTKIMASSPITSWQIDGEPVETEILILGLPKSV